MKNNLDVFTGADEVSAGAHPRAFLFECAPDSAVATDRQRPIGIESLLGSPEVAKRRAFALARLLLDGEPLIRGLQQLGIFEELVIRDLQQIFHLIQLHHELQRRGISDCRFASHSRWSQGLAELSAQLGSGITVHSPPASLAGSPLHRSVGRLSAAGFSRSLFLEELGQGLQRLDPYQRRFTLDRWLKRKTVESGQLWFLSTAATYTRIGLLYEPYFPRPFQFIVANVTNGAGPLSRVGRTYYRPHFFAARADAPSKHDISLAGQAIRDHVRSIVLDDEDALARKLFLSGGWFGQFLKRHLPEGLYETTLYERFIERAAPSALVVGNPVFEGYALHAARKRGIPTVLLQHGVLGDYCQLSDPPADHYVVRGRFWQDFLAEVPRRRSSILNVPAEVTKALDDLPLKSTRGHILFVTAPYGLQEFWNLADLDDIMLVLLQAASKTGHPLAIRVHPLEQVDFYQRRVQELSEKLESDCPVQYSQGAGEDEIVANAAVAVIYSSTMFLSCLRHRVPVVACDWHHFSFKPGIKQRQVFHFATSLADLSSLVERGAGGRLPAFDGDASDFLAQTEIGALRAQLKSLVNDRGAP